jgi:chorismate mutase
MGTLNEFRGEIDKIDSQIVGLLVERMAVIEKIKIYKKENNLIFFDKERYCEILDKRGELGEKSGLDKLFVREIFNSIHKASLDRLLDK